MPQPSSARWRLGDSSSSSHVVRLPTKADHALRSPESGQSSSGWEIVRHAGWLEVRIEGWARPVQQSMACARREKREELLLVESFAV
jgi:hypothetical protein